MLSESPGGPRLCSFVSADSTEASWVDAGESLTHLNIHWQSRLKYHWSNLFTLNIQQYPKEEAISQMHLLWMPQQTKSLHYSRTWLLSHTVVPFFWVQFVVKFDIYQSRHLPIQYPGQGPCGGLSKNCLPSAPVFENLVPSCGTLGGLGVAFLDEVHWEDRLWVVLPAFKAGTCQFWD